MGHITANRVGELTTSEGTGSLALSPAVSMRRFGSVMQTGDTCWVLIVAVNPTTRVPLGDYEVGRATYLGNNTLGRGIVFESSNGNQAVNFAAGMKVVSMTIAAPDARTIDEWLAALGISASDSGETATQALVIAVSAYARTETMQLNSGG